MKKSPWREKSKNHASEDDFFNVYNYDKSSEDLFKLHIPSYFKELVDFNDPNDPLLLQVLPSKSEHTNGIDFSKDPVGDLNARKAKGVIHKYHGRVLLISSGTCAINCRYCFRRSFPYTQNNASANNWKDSIDYISKNKDINEVILSGGDPLMLSTKVLEKLTNQLKNIRAIKTLRIHTRIPLVSPSRITDNLLNWLYDLPFKKVMVLHCNHPKELTDIHKQTFESIKNTNTLLLNQSVLLNNINDDFKILCELSHKLFDFGVLPYYLNQLDKVNGTKHFQVNHAKAISIHKKLLEYLPGYLVPKLVEEIPGKKNKTPMF